MADDLQANPLLGYGGLPTYTNPCEEHLILWCLVQGDPNMFKVTPPLDFDIDDLQQVIHAKGIDTTKFSVLPKDLVLWKLSESEPFEPEETFARRLSTKLSGNLSEVATEPSPWTKLSVLFPQQPSQDCLHIIIQIPNSQKRSNPRTIESNNYTFKRPRSSDAVLNRRLHCLIEGESVVFTVTAGHDVEVGDLKRVIQSERALDTLKNVDPHTLELWKVNVNLENGEDEDSLGHLKIEENGEGVEKLTPWKSIGEYWSDQLPITYLHIIVKVPAARE